MVTDDERREVARRLRHAWANVPDANPIRHHLRVLCAIYEAVGFSDVESDAIDLFDRLADLIEPGDTSQSCRDSVACDREAPDTCEHWLDGECYALRTVRPVDRETLLALADKARKLGDEEGGPASYAVRCTFRVFARDIYEALGEVVA